jgi:tRNA(Ile)-lysidine synthase
MDLVERFTRHVLARGFFDEGDRVVVACSGGLDSSVLAHLLRWSPGLPELGIVLAHFDHRMREGSGGEASWVRGLAAAWEIPMASGAAVEPPRNEEEARTARYAFLSRVRESQHARWLLTAHHADDQVETVLFRILRGTGLAGLRGVPEIGAGGVLRPLLPFRREELGEYAGQRRVPFLADPSNLDLRHARNVIRHEILPRAEKGVAAGARHSLLRLARLARTEEMAWRSLYPTLLEGVLATAGPGEIALARPAFLSYHPAVRARLLREVARRAGVTLDEPGTRTALEFTSSGASGRRIFLAGGLVLSREFDRLVLSRGPAPRGSEVLRLTEPEGSGAFALNGRRWQAEWSCSGPTSGHWTQSFALDGLVVPLELRGWTQGDRIRMSYGSKKLKKLFAEARVPLGERSRRPVLVDGRGLVLWVPGVARSIDARDVGGGARLTISVTETDPE